MGNRFVDVAPSNQVNWLATVGNTFYLTGLQIEEGDQATDFEHLSFAEGHVWSSTLCQRYGYGVTTKSFDQSYEGINYFTGTGNYGMSVQNGVFPVEMRAERL